MTYTTINDVSLYLRTTFDENSTPTLTQVQSYINEVDELVDQITGRTWADTEFIEKYDIEDFQERILLKQYPTISLTQVEYNTGDMFNESWEQVTGIIKDNFLILQDYLGGKEDGLQVTYRAGYSTTPSDIKDLATMLVVKKIVFGDATAKSGTTSLGIGSLSITKSAGLSRMASIDDQINQIISRLGGYKAYIS